MVITSYGFSCMKIQSGDTVMAIDPFGKGVEKNPPRFEAHLVLMTNPKAKRDFALSGTPILFDTPGEYEARGISCVGLPSDTATPFYIEWEDIRLLDMGDIQKLSEIEDALEHIDSVDILMVSNAGSSDEVQKMIAHIEPRIVIPMQTLQAKKTRFDIFVKELGEKPETLPKLVIKKKGLPSEHRQTIVLDQSGS